MFAAYEAWLISFWISKMLARFSSPSPIYIDPIFLVYVFISIFYRKKIIIQKVFFFFFIFPGIDRTVSYFPDGISRDFSPSISHAGISQTTLFLSQCVNQGLSIK